ncbi:glycyl-tRNA synthetase [Teratosphaeria destructans]|uniref:glycine--tRNA ligase n=1 Tax=Teratosphaeria destructans TaxID=418781 RepID=A0A9W7VYR8_9PEZI|nr:glycyl-tRNA synthetase [Teratosphaeria destructans]
MATRTLAGQVFDRTAFDAVIRRRLFFTESFEIYRTAGLLRDNRGLYDYGPPGCSLQANIVDLWRKHFVLEEDMLELDCTVLTPEEVFKTSGHVDKFADWMCRDTIKGDYVRADHLLETVLVNRLEDDKKARATCAGDSNAKASNPKQLDEGVLKEYESILAQIDNYDGDDLGALIKRLEVRNPETNNEVSPPMPFNLMFKSSIGPSAAAPVYLRPETAQGQFLNFRKLLEYHNNAMPFASASVGKSYRNEISPRSGLLRVREFLMAEIEHFVDPHSDKRHSRFDEVSEVQLPLLDRDTQLAGSAEVKRMHIGDAVRQKVVDNETLGYFLARIQAFLLKIGVDQTKLRFRQHLPNEMAHYACDCWDAELFTSYGWIECVGCADRSAYDLTVHMQRTKDKLIVRQPLSEPRVVTEWQPRFDKRALGKTFRGNAKLIEEAVCTSDQQVLANYAGTLAEKGAILLTVPGQDAVRLGKDMLKIEKETRTESVREYVPNVIEPSFGIGRILYSLLEHVYWHRDNDVARAVLSLPPSVAPTKVLIVPLSSQATFLPLVRSVSQRLRKLGISSRIDDSGASIGKRYSRNDELGTPLGVTIDFDTVTDGSITLRDRDSTQQVRGSQEEVIGAIRSLIEGDETWQDISRRLPIFTTGDTETANSG